MAEARAALAKLAGPCWEVQVRYGVAGPDRPDRQGRLRARAHALAAAFAVHSGRNRLGRHRLHRPARTLAARPLHRGDLLSTGELASLAHLPADPAVPGLARAGARPVPPPPGLPTTGKLLGDSELGTPRPVRLTPADACQHVHLLGATGSGKSTLITNLALQDIEAGRGVVVVDPKGDLITDLLDRLPERALSTGWCCWTPTSGPPHPRSTPWTATTPTWPWTIWWGSCTGSGSPTGDPGSMMCCGPAA